MGLVRESQCNPTFDQPPRVGQSTVHDSAATFQFGERSRRPVGTTFLNRRTVTPRLPSLMASPSASLSEGRAVGKKSRISETVCEVRSYASESDDECATKDHRTKSNWSARPLGLRESNSRETVDARSGGREAEYEIVRERRLSGTEARALDADSMYARVRSLKTTEARNEDAAERRRHGSFDVLNLLQALGSVHMSPTSPTTSDPLPTVVCEYTDEGVEEEVSSGTSRRWRGDGPNDDRAEDDDSQPNVGSLRSTSSFVNTRSLAA